MTAEVKYKEILAIISAELTSRGFGRKGLWFTKRPFADERFWSIGIRKIPQVASKRIVFQVVARAGRTPPGDLTLIGTLDQALTHATFERHISEGPMELLWTVWPSTDAPVVAEKALAAINSQCLPALESYSFP